MINHTDEGLQKMLEFAKSHVGVKGAIPQIEGEINRRSAASQQIENEEKAGYFRWEWNSKQGHRDRQAACLVISPEGEVYHFEGQDILKVVKVLNAESFKKGKWGSITYTCLSRIASSHIDWKQDWNNGLFWPQATWGEAIAWVQSQAPQATRESIEALIRGEWNKAARKFDENDLQSGFFD